MRVLIKTFCRTWHGPWQQQRKQKRRKASPYFFPLKHWKVWRGIFQSFGTKLKIEPHEYFWRKKNCFKIPSAGENFFKVEFSPSVFAASLHFSLCLFQKCAIPGLFSLFNVVSMQLKVKKCFWWLDSNLGPLVSEAIALITVTQPLDVSVYIFVWTNF